MLSWSNIWDITNNSIASGVVPGIIVNELTKMMDNNANKLKVTDAFFKEKNIGDVTKLRFDGETIRPEDRLIVGQHKSIFYIYAETGFLFFTLQGKIKRLHNVTLIYSNDDLIENVENIKDFCESLNYERLHQKSRNGMPVFRSKCNLCYTSKSTKRIKNFLVCVDGAKKGYDFFVLQTLQSPLGKYSSSFVIDENQNITSSQMSIPAELTKKRDFGITDRIVKIDSLDKMMYPFFINGKKVMPGDETEAFKSFINSFKEAYELQQVKLN